MASSDATSVNEYLEELPAERREPMKKVLGVVRKNIPKGFEERMQFGMINWVVPFSRFANTYNKQPLGAVALASQKGYMSLYLIGVYGMPAVRARFEAEYAKSGKKLDMGKSCLRFRSVDDLALDVVGRAIASATVDDMIAMHEAAHSKDAKAQRKAAAARGKSAAAGNAAAAKSPAAAKKTSGKKTGGKKTAATKTAGTKTAGTKTAGTKTVGTKTAGTKTAGTKTAGTKTGAKKTAAKNSSATKARSLA